MPVRPLRARLLVLLVPAGIASCELPSSSLTETASFELNFRNLAHGWEPGFSDYAPDQGEGMELEAGHEPLPESLGDPGSGLYIAGTNHSDDLFMFWKGREDRLPPSTRFRVSFRVEFATEAPSGCAGNGGPPGEAVHLKVGAVPFEPEAEQEEVNGAYFVLNVDKGNQAQEGSEARILGHVGNTLSGCHDPVWEFKTLEEHTPYETTTAPDGSIWFFVGTDSGFEGRTRLYYTRFFALFEPI